MAVQTPTMNRESRCPPKGAQPHSTSPSIHNFWQGNGSDGDLSNTDHHSHGAYSPLLLLPSYHTLQQPLPPTTPLRSRRLKPGQSVIISLITKSSSSPCVFPLLTCRLQRKKPCRLATPSTRFPTYRSTSATLRNSSTLAPNAFE